MDENATHLSVHIYISYIADVSTSRVRLVPKNKGPATNSSYTFVNRYAANILLVFWYETKHEAIAEGEEVIGSLFRFFV